MKHLFVIGTRPEVIKCAPVIKVLRQNNYEVILLATGQHADLITPLLNFFNLSIDINLSISNDGNHDNLRKVITELLVPELHKQLPNVLWVQGDTTTALSGALAAKNVGIKIAHIESGLRSFNHHPYPEEYNRTEISKIADFHFCPCDIHKENLINEGVSGKIFVTGNTVIDSLLFTRDKLLASTNLHKYSKPYVLFTCHRREWTYKTFKNLCHMLKRVFEIYPKISLIFPVHPSPLIKTTAHDILSDCDNIHLIAPCDYPEFVSLMLHSEFILTDSGGIQEEAPSLNIPVFILREVTERPEILETGSAKQWGMEPELIKKHLTETLENLDILESMKYKGNPFGDGDASKRIVSGIIQTYD